jgi:hypothetical protein
MAKNDGKVRNSDIFANMSSLASMKVLYNPADFALFDFAGVECRTMEAMRGQDLSDAVMAALAIPASLLARPVAGCETGRWSSVDHASGCDRTVVTTYARVSTLQPGAQAPLYPVTRPARAVSFLDEEHQIGQESRKEINQEINQETQQAVASSVRPEEVATEAKGSQESRPRGTYHLGDACRAGCYAGPVRRPIVASQDGGEADTGTGPHPAGLV